MSATGERKARDVRTVNGDRIPSRTYIPSADAGIKPLRLARMGSGVQQQPPDSPKSSPAGGSAMSSSMSTSSFAGTNASEMPRYSASQRSGKAMAAEAAALVGSRQLSGKLLREAVSSGKLLPDALKDVKERSASHASTGTYREPGTVGSIDADELLSSLGLGDIDLTEEEAEAFLRDGNIPEGLESGGGRLSTKAAKTAADKAREQVAARELAQRAREKGFGKGKSRRTHSETSIDSASTSGEAYEVGNSSVVLHEDQPMTPLESLTPSGSAGVVTAALGTGEKAEEADSKILQEGAATPAASEIAVEDKVPGVDEKLSSEDAASEAQPLAKAEEVTPKPSPSLKAKEIAGDVPKSKALEAQAHAVDGAHELSAPEDAPAENPSSAAKVAEKTDDTEGTPAAATEEPAESSASALEKPRAVEESKEAVQAATTQDGKSAAAPTLTSPQKVNKVENGADASLTKEEEGKRQEAAVTTSAPMRPSNLSSAQRYKPVDMFPPVKPRKSAGSISSPAPGSAVTTTTMSPSSSTSELKSSVSAHSFEDDMAASPPKYNPSTDSSSSAGITKVTVVRYNKSSYDSDIPAPKAVSTSTIGGPSVGPEKPQPPKPQASPPPPAVPSKSSGPGTGASSASSPKGKTPAAGHQRTLSDILREADAAMEDGEDLDFSGSDAVLAMDRL